MLPESWLKIQHPELSALEKRVLLLVSIAAAGGAEQRRDADRDHKPTGICTKWSKVDFEKNLHVY